MRLLYYIWLLNVVLIIDWAKNQRAGFWLFALVCLGPLGAMAYIIHFYEQINFPFRLAATIRKLSGKKVKRRCPRCGVVGELQSHQDGRQFHFMCERCIQRTYMEPHDSLEVLDAAQSILKESRDPD